jgi:hypothetical protein
VAASDTSILWTWTDNSSNETGFKLYSSTGTLIATIAASATSYTETGLTADTTYSRKILAYNSNGSSAYSSVASATTDENPAAVTSPTLVSPQNGAYFNTLLPSFTFKRSEENGATISSYTIVFNTGDTISIPNLGVGEDQTLSQAKVSGSQDNITVDITDDDLLEEGSHTWLVRATDSQGGTAISNAWSFSIDVTSPDAVTAIQGSTAGVDVDFSTDSNSPTFTLTFTDGGSGLVLGDFTVKENRSLLGVPIAPRIVFTQSFDLDDGQQIVTFTTPVNLPNGTYTFILVVTDNAGNARTITKTFVVKGTEDGGIIIDPTPPPTIPEIIETIEKGETPSKTPKDLQLQELQKNEITRREKQAENLNTALLQIGFPQKTLDSVNCAISSTVRVLRNIVTHTIPKLSFLDFFKNILLAGRDNRLSMAQKNESFLNDLFHIKNKQSTIGNKIVQPKIPMPPPAQNVSQKTEVIDAGPCMQVTQRTDTVDVYVTAGATIISFASLISLFTSFLPNVLAQIPYLSRAMFQILLGLLAVHKRRKPWGKVLSAIDGSPIQGALVSIIDAERGKVVETSLSGKDGSFSSFVEPGKYLFKVTKPGWRLNDQPLPFGLFDNNSVYQGTPVVSSSLEQLLSIVIVLRPEERQLNRLLSFFMIILQFFERFLLLISWPILLAGTAWNTYLFITTPSVLNFWIEVFYALLIVAKIILQRSHPKTLGTITDLSTKQPVSLALVRVFDFKTNRLVATKVTNSKGQFFFMPNPGTYSIHVTKEGYRPHMEPRLKFRSWNPKLLAVNWSLVPEIK